ncbi:membrane protein [Mangrovibacter sp. MFB070]|uniref:DUF2534 family protein n=1 Tax=Mangrovibacter sp. MFB070 TaxID=1224318 RepID=UPI0004D9AD5D|nr:DUF2534 family protein [Mangrovibacter sp. MFB070]KEA52920.1 membrane protein [Mangrovibacter sp. MFB070]
MFEKLHTRNGKKFLLCVALVFIVALSVIGKATFGGVVDEYNMPMSEWSVSMYFMQSAWVLIYTLMFTIIGSLPFGFYFLGETDKHH